MEKSNYHAVPGRGLNTASAIAKRLEYLGSSQIQLDHISNYRLDLKDIDRNIESFIGSVELPVGIVGPLLFKELNEYAYCPAATLEGALVASMNRGAKAISLSGGINTKVIHQKMVRTPLLIFKSEKFASHFAKWIKNQFEKLAQVTKKYSNHAVLLAVEAFQDKENIHLQFSFKTGDASGQNMTTTCTWHALLWINEQFEKLFPEELIDFVIEGNGASDKKASNFLINHGRGIKVKANCILTEQVINDIFRTTSEELLRFYLPSRAFTEKQGMLGYSINAANAIAAIFASTGQDLASVHESSVADFKIEKHAEGLYAEITLFSLVIGTVGGGTHVEQQNEGLKIMNCEGQGKVERFAKLISGFVLGLELSTFSAIVSGEFAKAHEKLGRNKPVNWLQKHELNQAFVKEIVQDQLNESILTVKMDTVHIDNGILMNLSKKVNRKLIGFYTVHVITERQEIPILIKSKPTDLELIKGLHLMASSIDVELSDLISEHAKSLEYFNSHLKELSVSTFINKKNIKIAPAFYGCHVNSQREVYILLQELLLDEELELIDSENSPELWTRTKIRSAISAINKLHCSYLKNSEGQLLNDVQLFDPGKNKKLYRKINSILKNRKDPRKNLELTAEYIDSLDTYSVDSEVKMTLIHNDFSPRNIAVKKNGQVCIYDWELSVIDYPHRDIVELLSFTLNDDFTKDELEEYLVYHYEIAKAEHPNCTWEGWKLTYLKVLKSYLVSRISFYAAAEIVMKLKFVDRIFRNTVKMIAFLEEKPDNTMS